jgi:molecular chaperone GrpE
MTTRKHPHDAGDPQAGDPREPATASLEAKKGSPRNQGESLRGSSDLVGRSVAELESELAETRDKYLRLAADFENYKKRMRQDQLETIQHASAELIARLLPVLDDLQNVLDHKPRGIDPSWVKGLELSVRKLEEALGTHGLQPIDSIGSRFDPKLHEAVGHEESTEHPEDTVVSELRRGYRIRDRVVRPALVKLARPPVLPADNESN